MKKPPNPLTVYLLAIAVIVAVTLIWLGLMSLL